MMDSIEKGIQKIGKGSKMEDELGNQYHEREAIRNTKFWYKKKSRTERTPGIPTLYTRPKFYVVCRMRSCFSRHASSLAELFTKYPDMKVIKDGTFLLDIMITGDISIYNKYVWSMPAFDVG